MVGSERELPKVFGMSQKKLEGTTIPRGVELSTVLDFLKTLRLNAFLESGLLVPLTCFAFSLLSWVTLSTPKKVRKLFNTIFFGAREKKKIGAREKKKLLPE